MIDTESLQRHLASAGHSPGLIDAQMGPATMKAVRSYVASRVPASASWSDDRRLLAANQLVMKDNGIEVGAIDGLAGPQTTYALTEWHRLLRSRPGREEEDDTGGADLAPPVPRVENPSLRWPRQAEVRQFYGEVGKNQVRLPLPYRMRLAWDLDQWVDNISLHAKVAESAGRAFARVAQVYTPAEIKKHGFDIFSGSLNVRKMRGGTQYSMHSWGIAIDFDNQRNELNWGRDRAYLARPECKDFLDAWEAEGWLSLGRARNYDWMHVQAARL